VDILGSISHFADNLGVWFNGIIEWLVVTIGELGYLGIVSLMFLESSFFPFPSEVVMIPAGYHVWKGDMSFVIVVSAGILGSIFGALFNYWIAAKWGRPFFVKYGKYFFVSLESLDKADKFFLKHGEISTLAGRLIFVIRQYISLPAGLSGMNIYKFTLWTSIGSGIWVTVLTLTGYFLGEHQEKAKQYLPYVTVGGIIAAVLIVVAYIIKYKRKKN
jgi:membrane protein DedA with SNARE-associated domain